MKIEKVMKRDVFTCQPGDTLNTVAKMMWEHDCGAVPVVADEKVVGMITDRDICMAAYTQGKPLWEIRVDGVMSRALHVCRPSDTVLQAQKVMRTNRIRRLPVVDDAGGVVGIVSLSDIVAAAEAVPERSRKGAQVAVAETLNAIVNRHDSATAPAD